MLNLIDGALNRVGEWLNAFVERAPVPPEEKTRLFHYAIFLAVGLPTMLVYGVINLFQGNLLICLILLVCGVSLFASLLILGRLKDGRVVYRVNCFLFGLLIIYMMMVGGESGSKILWMYTFPLIAFFLFGKAEGFFWSAIVLGIALLAFWGPLQRFAAYAYAPSFKLRFITTYLLVSLITYWFEYSRFYYRLSLEEKNRVLEEEKARLNHEIKERRRLEQELRRLAATDSLTGAANRRSFMDAARKEFYRFQRYHHHLAVAMMDIDRFKRINDSYGHPAGDEVLKALVRACRLFLRESDMLGRVGGEEFALLLVETGAVDAQMVAERLRQKIAAIHLDPDSGALRFTVSIGVTNALESDQTVEAILKRADTALYQAKAAGRNRVVCR